LLDMLVYVNVCLLSFVVHWKLENNFVDFFPYL
jgi:hypothetical protein